MRGRKPKPTDVKRADGNPGGRPLNKRQPAPPALLAVAVPDEVGSSPVARAEWVRLVPMLRGCRQVTEADNASLVAVCVEWARYLEANTQIEKMGTIIKNAGGYLVANPHLAVSTRALQSCIRLWAELGLTPSSRSRVVLPPDASDPFGEFDKPVPGAVIAAAKQSEESASDFQ